MDLINRQAAIDVMRLNAEKQAKLVTYWANRNEQEFIQKYTHGEWCFLNAEEEIRMLPAVDVKENKGTEKTDYISREDAVSTLKEELEFPVENDYDEGLKEGISKAIFLIGEWLPSTEVPIDPEDKKCDYGHGIVWQLTRDDDWFCADGERR